MSVAKFNQTNNGTIKYLFDDLILTMICNTFTIDKYKMYKEYTLFFIQPYDINQPFSKSCSRINKGVYSIERDQATPIMR
jgi:hypothetical protein